MIYSTYFIKGAAYLLPVLFYAGLNSLTVYLFRKPFGIALPFTMMLSVLWVYCSQFLFQSFTPGILLLVLLAVCGIIVFATRKQDRGRFVSPGFWAFLMICAVVTVLDYHRHLFDFDEYWHWGMMIKESLRLDRFYCVDASRMVIHKDYPPFLSVLELIWVRVAGRYAEDIATIPLHVLLLSVLVLPVEETSVFLEEGRVEPDQSRKITTGFVKRLFQILSGNLLLLVSVFLIINALDRAHIFVTLLADVPLAALFAFGLLQIITGTAFQTGFGVLQFFLTGIFLVMTKQAGLALLLVLWLYYLLIGFVGAEKGGVSGNNPSTVTGPLRSVEMNGSKVSTVKLLFKSLIFLAVPLMVYKGWTGYVKALGVSDIRSIGDGNGQFDFGKINVTEYIDAVLRRVPGLRQDTFWSLIKALVNRPVTGMKYLPLSYAGMLLLLLLLLVLLHRRFPDDFSKKHLFVTAITFFIGAAGYAFMLSVLFLFCFTTDEMQELRGYQRYVDAYITGAYLFVFLTATILSLSLAPEKSQGRRKLGYPVFFVAAVTVVTMLLTGPSGLKNLVPQKLRTSPYEHYYPIAELLLEKTTPDSRITIIYDRAEGTYGYWYGSLQSVVYYYLNDRDILWGKDLFNTDYSKPEQIEQAEKQIKNSDYLLVLNTNKGFSGFFSKYHEGRYPKRAGVYRVDKKENEIVFIEQ